MMFLNQLCCCVKRPKVDNDGEERHDDGATRSRKPSKDSGGKWEDEGASSQRSSGSKVKGKGKSGDTVEIAVSIHSSEKGGKSERKHGIFSRKEQKKGSVEAAKAEEPGALKDRISVFESSTSAGASGTTSDLLREKDGTKPKKKKPTSKAFQEFETSGILIGFGNKSRQKKSSEEISEGEDGEFSRSAENLVSGDLQGARSRSRDHSNSNSNANSLSRLTDDEGIHTMDEEDEFAAVTRNTEVLKSFRRAPPPKNRSKARPNKRLQDSRHMQSSLGIPGFDFPMEIDEESIETDGQTTPSHSIDSITSRSDRATPDDDTGTSGHITGEDSPRGATPESQGALRSSRGTTPEKKSVTIKEYKAVTVESKNVILDSARSPIQETSTTSIKSKSYSFAKGETVTSDKVKDVSAKKSEKPAETKVVIDANVVIREELPALSNSTGLTMAKMQNERSPVLRPPSDVTGKAGAKASEQSSSIRSSPSPPKDLVLRDKTPKETSSPSRLSKYALKQDTKSQAEASLKPLNITAAHAPGITDITSPTFTSTKQVLLKPQSEDTLKTAPMTSTTTTTVKIRSRSIGQPDSPTTTENPIGKPPGGKSATARPRSYHPSSIPSSSTSTRPHWAKYPSKSVDESTISQGGAAKSPSRVKDRSRSLVAESSDVLRKWDSEFSGLDAKRRRRHDDTPSTGESPKIESEKHPLSIEARKKVFQAKWETAI